MNWQPEGWQPEGWQPESEDAESSAFILGATSTLVETLGMRSTLTLSQEAISA